MMGVKHFTEAKALTSYASSKGVPSPKLSVFSSGLFIFFGGLGVIFNAYTSFSLGLIIVFLFLVSMKMHNFWAIQDPQQKMAEQANFLKNFALLGAALMLLFLLGS